MDLKSQYEAYENSKRIKHIADEETAKRLSIPVGSEYTTFPPPTTKEEAFERLEKYTGLIHLDSHIRGFKTFFPINQRTLNDELKKLNQFIDKADKINVTEAFTKRGSNQLETQYFEYLKWKYDFYKNETFDNLESYFNFFPTELVFVYGKYFLYKNWIEDQIKNINPIQDTSKTENDLKVTAIGSNENPEKLENKSQYLDIIQDHLEENDFVNDGSYQNLVNALDVYFDLGVFPQPTIQIKFSRVAKIKIGWALNNIHREAKPNEALSYEYLKYAKENLSIFKEYPLEEMNFRKSNLYKMFTQKPK
ncbi:hypothetical protein KIH23_10145 [Flavobacterium sp. CYK-55]|uniref:hypothetical protein n=1 Tax=Flavobacterium sp. CYK-55 TaxID=2835529 RepID=UPI001BCCD518|nr:hypothetical protein [Flavobacterium sp. CYK-55]MBS7787658.1 hypothetical protein [Flavobacterium sp. CYK-55]